MIEKKLKQALRLASLPLPSQWQKIGSGAWHDAYLLEWPEQKPLIFRLRKSVIYGQTEQFEATELHSDYAPVGHFYTQANHVQTGVCPEQYEYFISPELSFTIESYMGKTLDYVNLTLTEAQKFGEAIGCFLKEMHAQPTEILGMGMVVWQNGRLTTNNTLTPAQQWQQERQHLLEQLPTIDSLSIRQKLQHCLQARIMTNEPTTLVNRDTTPENLITTSQNTFSGLIDPVPMIHSGTQFAAHFYFVYNFLLAAYNNTPRYAHHQFQPFTSILETIATGFLNGYAQNNNALQAQIKLASFLHLIAEFLFLRNKKSTPLSAKEQLKLGNHAAIEQRFLSCWRALAAFEI